MQRQCIQLVTFTAALLFGQSLAIRVLRNTLEVGDFESIGGASLVNASDNVVTQDLTICIKFNVKVPFEKYEKYKSGKFSRRCLLPLSRLPP